MCVCCSLVCLSGCYWFGLSSLKCASSLFLFEASAHTVTHWQDARYCASPGAESTVGPASASSGRTVAAVLSHQLWYVHWPCEIVGNVNTQIFDVLHSLHLFTIYGKWGFLLSLVISPTVVVSSATSLYPKSLQGCPQDQGSRVFGAGSDVWWSVGSG